MVYRQVLEWPNETLKKVSRDLDIEKDINITKDLLDTFKVTGGFGLSAPQIGFNVRAIVINESALNNCESFQKELLMINPVILKKEEDASFEEACFSVPGYSFDIERSSKVKVEWLNLTGEKESKWFNNYSSACVQHEIDHLNGILIVDKLSQLRKSMIIKKVKKDKLSRIKQLGLSKEEKSKRKSIKTRKNNRKNRKKNKK